MGNVNDRSFSLTFAAMKASKFMPKGKQRDLSDFGAFVAVFEEQLRLAGYRIVEDERPAAALPSCGD